MKKKTNKVLSVLLVVIMLLCAAPLEGFVGMELFSTKASAEDTTSGQCGDNVYWSYDTETATLTISGTGWMYDYSDSYYNGTWATSAPWGQYYNQMKTVIIEDGVTSIGDYAFYGCTSLTSVTIPDSFTYIAYNAFYEQTIIQCNKGSYAETFAKDANRPYALLDGAEEENTISGSVGTKLNWSIDRRTGSLTIDNKGKMVNFILDAAPWEEYYQYIHHVVINEGCETIGTNAFSGCDYIQTVKLPDSLTELPGSVFYNKDYLTSVDLGNGIKSIGDSAFFSCSSLTSVTIGNSVTSIGSGAFNGCNSLESIELPYSVRTIDSSAFSNCKSLTSITIYNRNCSISETAISIYATIYGFKGSTAETFADTYGYEFVAIDDTHEHVYKYDCLSSCYLCGEEREVKHSYGDWIVESEGSCYSEGYKYRVCSACGDTYTETIPATGHTDENHDGICDNCGFDSTEGCTCKCHKDKPGFFWKLQMFFWKLFRIEKHHYCECGKAHW